MARQWHYFVLKPCLVIFPNFNIEEAKNWIGEAYNTTVLIDSFDDDAPIAANMWMKPNYGTSQSRPE